jgi:Fur family ferric uptake transcriptional regulator
MILVYLKQKDVDTDPATIFRMMNDFLQKGITKEVQLGKGKSSYELANKGDHHHLVCETCGKIEAVLDNVVPEMEKELQKRHGFLIKRHSLEFFGLCKNCQK